MNGITFKQTDLGNAERLVESFGGDLRFVGKWRLWLTWDGQRWRRDERGGAMRFAKKTAQLLVAEALTGTDFANRALASLGADAHTVSAAARNTATLEKGRAEKELQWAIKSQSAHALGAMLKLAESAEAIAVAYEQLDADPWALNVANGTLDLLTGKRREHRRGDLFTKLAPVRHDDNATCPRFESFLDRVMNGDAERIEFLRRFLGYCLTGRVSEHVLTFWHGPGGNGKSVLANIIMRVLGDYATKAAPDLLFRSEKTERHPTELADLFGARFVVANETRRGRAWDESTVKDVTGGDVIKARRMHEDFWAFEPSHKIAVFGNHKPRFTGSPDGGMARRLRLVPFEVTIPKQEIDRDLEAKLWDEASGVLRWMLEGCLAWQRDGLTEPRAVTEATSVYFRNEDTFGQFFDAACVFQLGARVSRAELRAAYEAWAESRGEKPFGTRALADAARERGAHDGKLRVPYKPHPVDAWAGVRLKTPQEQEASNDVGGFVVCSVPESGTAGSTRERGSDQGENGALPTHYALPGDEDVTELLFDAAEREAMRDA